jgi:hypothetical protein
MAEIKCPTHYDADWWAGLDGASRLLLREVGFPDVKVVDGPYLYDRELLERPVDNQD